MRHEFTIVISGRLAEMSIDGSVKKYLQSKAPWGGKLHISDEPIPRGKKIVRDFQTSEIWRIKGWLGIPSSQGYYLCNASMNQLFHCKPKKLWIKIYKNG